MFAFFFLKWPFLARHFKGQAKKNTKKTNNGMLAISYVEHGKKKLTCSPFQRENKKKP